MALPLMASVYQSLGAYLARQPGPTRTLPFGEVEAIIGRPLPPTAYARRDWWTNEPGRSQADYGWLAAGWVVDTVDRGRQTVTFRKE
jgi:hypothetical protein